MSAFLPHTGRLHELLYPGARLLLTKPIGVSHRSLRYDVLAVWHGNVKVVVDTRLPNRLVLKALEAHAISGVTSYTSVHPEIRLGDSRIDFALTDTSGTTYLEVKSCALAREHVALFPDAPSTRSFHHAEVLKDLAQSGTRSVLLFVSTRPDVASFAPYEDVDPSFARALAGAKESGVKILAYASFLDRNRFYLGKPLRVDIG